MGKKITWVVSYSASRKYSAEITDEQAELFEKNSDEFIEEILPDLDRDIEWEDFSEEEGDFFQIEEN